DSNDLRGRIASDARAYLAGASAESPATLGIRTRAAARFTEPAKAESSRNTGIRSASAAPPQDRVESRGQDPSVLFPATPADSIRLDIASRATREASSSVPPETFLDLGRFASGGHWDFFILARGAARGNTAYTGKTSLNVDVVDHVVSHAYGLKDSPYLLLGYEDLYGNGDDSLDDLLFAIDLANINIAALTATPEPSTYVILGTLLAFGAFLKRRSDARAAAMATLPR
ncbi:MAG: PEP-CTERM sorting domain-containing protein, partial [Verrucomicrobiales bacterium]|nr:PEP-CTERM sorting domain-containing protein [Verrucomicrobiales bacterium]